MMQLSLLWFALGALLGALVLLARWAPRWAREPGWRRWLPPLALCGFTALVGGWLATFFLDRLIVTLAALMISIIALTVTRWWLTRAQP